MIPKIIHHCWFSGEDKPEIIKSCLNTWQNELKDYIIIEWTNKNFNLEIIPFTTQAYKNKKWAFIADYFRLWVLYNNGGIYLDSDVLVKKSFDPFLNNSLFMAWENLDLIGTHVIGSEKNNDLLKFFMNYYEERNFCDEENNLDMIPMPQVVTKLLRNNYKIKRNGKLNEINYNVKIYPMNYFTIDVDDGNNICNHLFTGSWNEKHQNYLEKMQLHYNKFYSSNLKRKLYLIYKLIFKFKKMISGEKK